MRYLLVLIALFGCTAAVSKNLPVKPDDLGKGHVSFSLPKVSRWELDNGLVVYYRFDEELPRISGTFYFPGGSLYEPAELAGVASAAGSEMREGSIRGLSPDVFDKTLDSMAAAIETNFGAENGSLSFTSLDEDFDRVFGYAAKIILEPQFEKSRFELWRKLSLDGIRRRRDDPDTMVGMSFAELLYGKHTSFTRYATSESISKIRIEDARRFVETFVRPNGSILAASGSIPETRFREAVEKSLRTWTRRKDPLPMLPEITQAPQAGVYVLQREFQQASVLMGHLGPPRLTPDIYEMNIYNRILGSTGFGSRLFDEIRTRLGLAYDVGGGIAPAVVKGTVQVSLGSRTEGALEAIKRSIEICSDTLETLPEETAFADAKSAVEQSFAFRFDGSLEVAKRAAQQELFHFPKDFDETYLERMANVSPEMVREVGKRWVRPRDFVVVLVGDISPEAAAKFFKPLGLPVYRMDFDTEPRVLGKVE